MRPDVDRILEQGGAAPSSPAPPFLEGRLPAYETLVYVEKLGLVVLTFAAILYLGARALSEGPRAAGAAAAAARGVR